MSDKKEKGKNFEIPRPEFPKRAVITGGMPYGNKQLHFGHVGGVFVFADCYARFLRDRIGKDNVIFVSGTDCYGSPIAEGYRKLVESGEFEGSIEDFVNKNHESQKKTLEDYMISLNLFAGSALGEAGKIHSEYSKEFITNLYKKGQLSKIATKQFYDEDAKVFLNGRQVIGKCPVEGCQSEKAYADECDLGHQYMPENLIDPKSTLSGKTPVMKEVVNWYFNLTDYEELLKEYCEKIKKQKNVRKLVSNTISEFLKKPVIYIKREFTEKYEQIKNQLPEHEYLEEKKKPSFSVVFENLEQSDKAAAVLSANGIRYRTGKTLVPFRFTGNIPWGVPAPKLESEDENLTVWVWPESLWAPISFTKAYLKLIGESDDKWKDYWCSRDAQVYQFIGQDNIYFYGLAEMGMFMAQNDGKPTVEPEDGQLQIPILVANNHILFLNKKASSSGNVKPPMAADLLNYYTPEQLRMHFLGLSLGQRSVSFMPKPLNPVADPDEQDPVVKDGFLLSNVFNRIIRTCLYTNQKYYGTVLPRGEVDEKILEMCKKSILDFERFMYRFEFHQCTYVLDTLIRQASKYMSKNFAQADKEENAELRYNTLVNVLHMVKTATVLLHPLAPLGTEKIADYLNMGEELFCWDNIFKTLTEMTEEGHEHKFLEPRVDFFTRHPSQFAESEE